MAIRNEELGGVDYQDTGSTTLDGAITDSDTTITVVSTTGFKEEGTIRVGVELIDYTGVTATEFTGCIRGQYGTTAVAHDDGNNVLEREVVKAEDMNDTIDAMVNKVQTLTAFWLNSELYDIYDDFDSYSTGTFTTNDKWTVTATKTGSGAAISNISILESQLAGGSGKELYIRSQANLSGGNTAGMNVKVETKEFPKNRHIFARIRSKVEQSRIATSSEVRLVFGGTNYVFDFGFEQDVQHTNMPHRYFNLNVIAKGNDLYDIYIGGFKVAENKENTTGQWALEVRASGNTSNGHDWRVHFDDVLYSKGEVE
jgi:hypothetical protein